MSDVIRVGTRGSALAVTQSGTIADAIATASGRPVELVTVTTRGDVDLATPLAESGGVGVFVVAVREALLRGDVDVAVHSLKDLPTAAAPGLALASVPLREDPRDVLCARDGLLLHELPAGARVGTGAPRRMAQLRILRPDLEVVGVRGNVDTRLAHVSDGSLDAVVLARAGLARLGRLAAVTEVFDPLAMLPAPGQGALAVECRDEALDQADPVLAAALRELDDPLTRAAVTAERSLLAALEAGCSAPLGAYADVDGDGSPESEVYLRAAVVAVDGSRSIRMSITGPLSAAADLGRRLADDLLGEGASGLMGERIP
jgi:hydroxymethylbilane synthase